MAIHVHVSLTPTDKYVFGIGLTSDEARAAYVKAGSQLTVTEIAVAKTRDAVSKAKRERLDLSYSERLVRTHKGRAPQLARHIEKTEKVNANTVRDAMEAAALSLTERVDAQGVDAPDVDDHTASVVISAQLLAVGTEAVGNILVTPTAEAELSSEGDEGGAGDGDDAGGLGG